MSQKGISFRLNSHITTIAIIIIGAIVFSNYYFGKKVLVNKIQEGAINQSNLVVSKISRITIGTEEITKNLSFQALYFYRNHDLDFLLHEVLTANKIIESIHVELIDKEQNRILRFTSCKEEDAKICKTQLATPQNLISELNTDTASHHQGLWKVPFFCGNDTTHLLASYQMPIYYPDTKNIAGVVSCEISLKMMEQMLSEIEIGKSGYAFIVDNNGNFITHPNKKWILKRNLFNRPTVSFKGDDRLKFESEIRQGHSGAFLGISEYLNKQKSWYYFSPLANSSWSVIIVIPQKELFSEIEYIYLKIILVAIIGIIILFFVNIYVFRKLLNPLVRVIHAIQRFTSPLGKESESKNEIIMLAQSLEDWQNKYGLLIKNQSKTDIEKIKFEKDLKSAQEIQFNIVPRGNPAFPEHQEIDLYALLKPAESVGGDLYDYFFIDKNHLLVVIGDVSGKGIPASLFMAIASTLIKSNAKILSSKKIVSLVNKELSERNSNQYFVTLFLGILDVRSGLFDYCNAAHNYPYILHADGTYQTLSRSHGLPLGIYKDKTYKSSSIEFQENDTLILYTDGVINSRDSSNKHYGTDKLEKNIQNLNDLTSEELVKKLLKSILIFEGEDQQADDITILALKYLYKAKDQE